MLSMYSFDELRGGTELFTEHLRSAFDDARLITYSSTNDQHRLDLTRLGLEEARKGVAISRHLERLHCTERFDLVISNSTSGWCLGLGPLDVPMINVFHFTLRGLAGQVLRGTPGYLPSMYISSVFEKLASIRKTNVAVSSKVARELWSLYRIRSRVIEHGVDMERFRPLPKKRSREMIGLDVDGPVGLFVGRADRTKGFDILDVVRKKMPGVRFVCVTSSNVNTDGLIVHRSVPNERMPLYYSAADFLLFPSRYESVGYAGLEAMSCDIPVVTSRTGIFEDMDEDGIGRIVPTWEPSDYVKAVDDVLSRPFHPRMAIGERYSMKRFLDDYRSAAEDAVN